MRAELNGNPVQSGGPNRERLYRPGRARSRIMGGCRRTGRADRVGGPGGRTGRAEVQYEEIFKFLSQALTGLFPN